MTHVDLAFDDLRLARAHADHSVAVRLWGEVVARKYAQRIELIASAPAFPDLVTLAALRLHPLKGPLAGRWAMVLHGRWRLIVAIEGNSVRIMEVSNHYDD